MNESLRSIHLALLYACFLPSGGASSCGLYSMEQRLGKNIKIKQRQTRTMNAIRKRRFAWVVLLIFSSLLVAFLILQALSQNINLFFTPTEVATGKAKQGHAIRIGGMVKRGTLLQGKGLNTEFIVTDFAHSVIVKYTGILPDLFKEGQGVVVLGRLDTVQSNLFYADQVLAKHDENYMPPEVNQALKTGLKKQSDNPTIASNQE